jgi:Ice-binding-like
MKFVGNTQRTAPCIGALTLSVLLAGCGGGNADVAAITARSSNMAGSSARMPVNLGAAGTFALLSQSGVTDVAPSAITGDVGSSPITGAAILLSCAEVTGTIYAVDAAGPAPCVVSNATLLAAAVADMQAAYTDAAGRTSPDYTELGAGEIGGLTLVPGLYKWGSGVMISTDVTLAGGPNDVWIFQVAGTLDPSQCKPCGLDRWCASQERGLAGCRRHSHRHHCPF